LMSFVWSFEPDHQEPRSNRDAYQPRERKKKEPYWVAPEHIRLAQDMKRDYPRNEKGERLPGPKELKLDKRPTIMVPPRPTRQGWL
jgi:hypothetical protein